MKQAFDADVLVDVRPMNSLARSMRRKFARCAGVASDNRQDQASGTLNDPPVGQIGDDLVLVTRTSECEDRCRR